MTVYNIVKEQLPIIGTNFNDAKASLEEVLKKYELVVQEGDVKVAKKKATELNAIAKQIDALRKEKVAELSAPIKEFDGEAKSLIALCKETRQKLLEQVAIFEEKTKKILAEKLNKLLIETYEKYSVDEEFRTAKVDDLIIISNNTKAGVAKKARDAIDDRVLECKQLQDKVSNRLLSLEGDCLKAGLQTPLQKANIEHFLKEPDDAVYQTKLNSLIESELIRFEKAMEAKKAKEAAKAQREQVAQQAKKIEEEKKEEEAQKQKKSIDSKYSGFKNVQEFLTSIQNLQTQNSGKKTYRVTAVFEIELDGDKSETVIANALKNKLKKAGFKSNPTITVEQVEKEIA